jgi:hypothetical protein
MKDNIVKLNGLLDTSQKGQVDNKTLLQQTTMMKDKEIQDLKKIIEEQNSKLQE